MSIIAIVCIVSILFVVAALITFKKEVTQNYLNENDAEETTRTNETASQLLLLDMKQFNWFVIGFKLAAGASAFGLIIYAIIALIKSIFV